MKQRMIVLVLIAVMAIAIVPTNPSAAQESESLFIIQSVDTPTIARTDEDSWHFRWNEPAGFVYHDGMFYFFRNGINTRVSRKAVGLSVSEDGLTWHPANDDEPVVRSVDFPLNRLGITMNSVIVLENGTWIGYVHTQHTQNWPYVGGEITLATADNPLGPWTPYDSIVLPKGSEGEWDANQTSYANVHQTDDGFVMYYGGFDENNVISIGMATSDDGFTWTKYDDPTTTEAPYAESDPIIVGVDGKDATMPQAIYTEADGWVMLYKDVSYNGDIFLATSDDGIEWETQDVQPIAESDFGEGASIAFMKLGYHDGIYYLFLEVSPTNQYTQIHLATYDGSLRFEN